MEVINFYSSVQHRAEIAKNHQKVHFCIFLLLSFKFISFQWPRPNKNPPAAIFSSSESEIAPSENFSENHEEENPVRIRGGIWEVLPIERLPLIFPFTGTTFQIQFKRPIHFPWRTFFFSQSRLVIFIYRASKIENGIKINLKAIGRLVWRLGWGGWVIS